MESERARLHERRDDADAKRSANVDEQRAEGKARAEALEEEEADGIAADAAESGAKADREKGNDASHRPFGSPAR